MKKLLALLVVVLAVAGLSGCGGDDDSDTAASAQRETSTSAQRTPVGSSEEPEIPIMDDQIGDEQVRVAADPSGEFRYFISEASSNVGKATVEFVNPTNTPHNVVVEDTNGQTMAETDVIRKGKTKTAIVFPKPIKYTYYCSVPGHRKKGMVGHITVYPNT